MNLVQAANNLRSGQPVTLRPNGHSMTPIIRPRQQVTISPVQQDEQLKQGEVVLVKLRGNWLLHRIAKVGKDQYQIANARGKVNGWASRSAIVGRVSQIHEL